MHTFHSGVLGTIWSDGWLTCYLDTLPVLISSGGDKVVGIVVYHEHCLWKLSGAITED